MSELFPGGILSLTAQAADRLLAMDSGDAALLYLRLLRHGAASGAPWPEPRLRSALALLESQGLAPSAGEDAPASAPGEAVTVQVPPGESPAGDPPPAAPPRAGDAPSGSPPSYSTEDLNGALESPPFSQLCDEVERSLGKKLCAYDLKTLLTLYDHLALPPEVILLLVTWCIQEVRRKDGPGRIPTLSQIRKEGFAWARQGVDSVDAAEEHVRRLSRLRERERELLRLLNIPSRPLVDKERSYLADWDAWGFDDEALYMAYERTVLKKQSMNWSYMNGILRGWHAKGLHTAAAIRDGDGQRPAAPGGAAPRPGGPPPDPAEQERRVREDMERMRRLMEKLGQEES